MKKVLYLFFAIILIAACAKDGETGPQGPEGPRGLNGGYDSVIVRYSAISPAEWLVNGTPGISGHAKYFREQHPYITNNVMITGLVIGYKIIGDTSYAMLPNLSYQPGNISTLLSGTASLGMYEFRVEKSDLSTPIINDTLYYRLITLTGTLRLMNSDLDWSNYNSVAERFNLK